jgi:hypothetical protein
MEGIAFLAARRPFQEQKRPDHERDGEGDRQWGLKVLYYCLKILRIFARGDTGGSPTSVDVPLAEEAT